MKKAFYEFLPIYERHIVYGNDFDAIIKETNKYIDVSSTNLEEILDFRGLHMPRGLTGEVTYRKQPDRIAFIFIYVGDDEGVGVVAHESVHACNFVFDSVGQLADEVNDEAQAYLTGHLSDRFMELIRGAKKRRRGWVKGDKKGNIK